MLNDFNKKLAKLSTFMAHSNLPPTSTTTKTTHANLYAIASADALSYSLMAQQPSSGPPNTGGQSTTGNCKK